MAGPRGRRGGGSSSLPSTLLLRLLLLAAVGPLAAWGFGPFGTGGSNSLRGDGSTTLAGGRRGGWVPPALRPVVRVSRRPSVLFRGLILVWNQGPPTDQQLASIDLFKTKLAHRWPSWRAVG